MSLPVKEARATESGERLSAYGRVEHVWVDQGRFDQKPRSTPRMYARNRSKSTPLTPSPTRFFKASNPPDPAFLNSSKFNPLKSSPARSETLTLTPVVFSA